MMKILRVHRQVMASLMVVLMTFWQIGQPLQAATFYWDADGDDTGNTINGTNLGGTGTWDLASSLWWPDPAAADTTWGNGTSDIAIFSAPFAALADSAAVTLATTSGVQANQLRFNRNGFTLTGGDFTLAGTTPKLYAEMGVTATINSQILGSDGLTKAGGGAIRLGNNLNSYTGTTTISTGSFIITGQGALGADASAILVTGFNPVPTSTNLRGFGGGALVLDGFTTGFTVSRDISLQGQGPVADRGGALISTGNNTLSGVVNTAATGGVFGATALNTRIIAADGRLTFSGTLNVGGTVATTITNLGGVNQAGASFYDITGTLTGTGTLEASGGGTLFLNPSDATGYAGAFRISASAASGQSVLRIDSPNVLGTRNGTGSTNAVLDMNGGILAVLMDSPSLLAGGSAANVYGRASSTFFADHTPNSSVKDQTVTFGQLNYAVNLTMTFNSRNGYGMTFTTAPVVTGDNQSTFTNNLQGGGLLTFTGAFWSNTNNTAARTFTIGGSGNTLISGAIVASSAAFDHVVTKTGTGTLTLTATTGVTLDGALNINGGTVAINDFRAVNNAATTNININGGILSVIGNNLTQANLTSGRPINMSGTTGAATILANQTGTSPGIVINTFTVSGVGTKTLTLGGTNLAANTINGAIVDNGVVSLTKIDAGRWVLGGVNTFTGATTISRGTLQLKANAATSTILADTSAIIFNAVNVYAGGTLELIGQVSTNNVETLGALTPTNGSGTIKLTPGSGGTASITFASLGTVGGGGTVNIEAPTASDTVKFTSITGITAGNIANAGIFYNGSDFALVPAANTAVRAPIYGTDADFTTSATVLTANANMQITGSFNSGAALAIDSLKILGSQTLTLGGNLTIRTVAAAAASGGIIQTGGSGTINGAFSIGTNNAAALVINVDGGANSLSLDSVIFGTGGFTKVGAGTLRLGAANNQTGTISINEGIVRLTTGGRLGAASAALTIRQDGILELNGITPATTTGAFNNNGIVRNTSATDVTFTVGGGNGAGSSLGIIEDGGAGKVSVVKLGTGGQSWLGLSTYTGTTTIDSTGIVTINNLQNGGMASGIGASSNAAGNLIFTGTSPTQAYAGISYTGTTNDETDRLFTFNGAANGGVRIQSNGLNNATSSWTNTSALAFGAAATDNAQGLVLGGASTGDNRFSPIITDNGAAKTSVYKADAGVWYLQATNTYSGVTRLDSGTLYAQDGTNIKKDAATGSNIVFNGGNFASTGAFNRTIGTAGDQMQWGAAANGGFSAGGTPLTVDWGAGNVWGTTVGFLGTGALLLNNSGVAKSDVTIVSGFDLGGGTRTVTVGDNTVIGADFATLAGVIEGAAAGSNLTKNGTGILNLRGANTYVGNTNVTAGTLVVTSLGLSTAAGATSVGDSTLGNTNAGAITLGNGTTTLGILEYVGLGEISDRKIRLNTTTAANQIHADGVGSLILTNVVNDMTAGAKILTLRGVSAAANFITSQLSDNGGALGITVDGSTAWILTNGANNYTGTTTVGAGALGIGHDSALGTGTLTFSSGSIFAYGEDRTLTNAVSQANNTTTGFIGEYSLTFGAVAGLAAANNWGTNNNLAAGKTLTFGAWTANALTANRTWTIDGPGTTIINGDFTTSTAFGVVLTKTGDGILVLGGSGANSFNKGGANIDIDRGTLKLGASGVIAEGAGFGNVLLTPELATGDTAIFDLNGFDETINGLTATTDGQAVIDNSAATAAHLTFGANDQAVTYIGRIDNTGAGALSLTKTGTGAATFSTGPFAHTGSTNVNGGTLTFAGNVSATTGISVTGGSTLSLNGGFSGSTGVTSLEVGGGSTLSLSLDNAGTPLSNLTILSLGNTGVGTALLKLNIGDGQTDTITLLTTGMLNLGNTVTFNMSDSGLSDNTTYTLLNVVDGGLTAFGIGNLIQGTTPGGFDSMTWFVNNNLVQITTGNLILGTSYWNGATGTAWNLAASQWSSDKAGTTAAVSIPGAGTDVVFASNNGPAGALTTTLEQNFKINSLTFEAGTTTPASVSIGPGIDPAFRLQVAPSVATAGITIAAGGPATVTISAPFKIGKDQTWTVVDAASTLSLSGTLDGEQDVIKAGTGKVILSGLALATFNPGGTSDFTVNGGNLEIQNVGTLGSTLVGNQARVTINTGGAFYYNGVASTATNLSMPLTLGGGTLSAGTATQIYNGTVNVSGNSFINMADSNGPATNTARSITLSGVVSGAGSLTIDSNNTVSGGNQLGGTLTLSNASNTWSGDLNFNRGTVTITNVASPNIATNNVTFNAFGRFNLQGLNGATLTRTGTLTYAAGAIGELGVDNTGAVVNSDFLVDQSGAVTLGSGGTGGNVRIFLSDAFSKMNITGGVTLGGNSSISVAGDALGLVNISSVISDGGNAYALAVNDDAGGWAQTNRTLRLSGLNTFSGNLTVDSGTLQFDTVTNIGGGASALGQGSAIIMGIGAARLTFIGSTSQSTDRTITTVTGLQTLSAEGTGGATITYAGAITIGPVTDGSQLTLTGLAGSGGIISGGITQTLNATDILSDMTVNGATWTHQTGTSLIADDMTVTGATTIFNLNSGLFQVRDDITVTAGANLNLNGVGVLSFNTSTLSADASLRATAGGVITLGANDAVVSTQFDGLRLGTDAAGVGTFDTVTFNQTVSDFILGNRNADRSGLVNGTGAITVSNNIDLYGGTVNANLASTGAVTLDKISLNTVTLAGDNSGLTGTGATVIIEGTLILDYTVNNATKLREASALDMRGSNLILNGNASAASSQTVLSFTLATGGSSTITLNPGSGQDLVLNLNAITRAVNAQDGTIRFNLPSGTQSATRGITTDTLNTIGTGANGIIGGWATVNDGTGVFFARNATNAADGNIVAAATTAQDAVGSWITGDNISDATGFTGTLDRASINSLRFNAASGSDLVLPQGGILLIGSGGILVTSSVGGTPSIVGGTLASNYVGATPELIFTQDSTQTFDVGADIRTNHIVIKTGTGTLRLTGNNVYTGLTEIQEGTLQVTGSGIGDNSIVTLSATRASSLELLADETIGRLQGGSRNTDQDLGVVAVDGHTLTINNSGGNTTYAGFFTGTGAIIKQGTHNLNLTNLSSGFTGIVTVEFGLLQLSGIGQINANIIRINKGGTLLIDNNSTTRSGTRILDTTAITLNSADGTFNGQTIVRGLAMRTDQGGTLDETVGVVNLNTGASYVGMEATTADDDSDIIANNILRFNNATVNVRGTNLGSTNARNNQFRIGDATNQTAFIAALVGGGGIAGTKNISIVPWAIGEDFGSAALADANMGNSLVTYDTGAGFRPLNFTTEYNTIALAAATDNARESLGADLTGLVGTTVNSLVINNTAFAGLDVTGNGAGETLAITSGALLFTVTGGAASTAYDTTLGGFDSGITVGGTNEYVIHVVNPSSAATTATLTATITSNLTATADITKSGRGTLILTGTNTAGGGAKKVTINEGILEIADLDNIGGNSGGLVFAGGILRLGTGLTDDISLRTITLLDGGGTIDTNGIDLALANSVGSGLGGLTKLGAGNLTLNSAATYNGATIITNGTLTIGANNATGNGGALTIGAGATLALGTSSITTSLLSTSGASPLLTGTGTITAAIGFVFSHTGDTTIDAVLAGSGGLFKSQGNILTLSGANTYTGTTEIQSGTVSFSSIANVGGGASSFGAPTTVEDGVIRMGLTTAGTTLIYTGSGSSSNRIIEMQGTTGGVAINGNGTGAVTFGNVQTVTAGNKTLTLRGTSDAGLANTVGAILEAGSILSVTKTDANTWVISGTSTYTGATTVQDGILRMTADQVLSGGLVFGAAATAGSLDLSTANAQFATLTTATNSGSFTNTATIGAGKTLTITGNVTLGANVAASTTLFTASGAGSFVNNNSGGTFQVGGATGATNTNAATADFGGLASFTVNLGSTGTFRIGDNSTVTSGVGASVLTLGAVSSITAGTLNIGSNQTSATQTLHLGSTSNAINADILNVGTKDTGRGSGVLDFATGTGTLTLRAADGASRAVLNMVNSTFNTGANPIATVDLTGHTADLLVSTLTMASRTLNTGGATASLTFDGGTLDVTTLNMASRTSTGTGGATATLYLGNGAGAATTTIGAVTMATNTSAGGAVDATINVTGGTVGLGAINMANAGTGRTVTSNINLTGGTTTLTGNITRTGGAGTENATVTLNGGTLDMGGMNIGSGAANVSFNAESGTLRNLAELNGGGALTKTTAGTLTLGNGNTYTGTTTVSAGTLLANNTSASASATGSSAVTVDASATLGGTGAVTAASAKDITINGTLSVGLASDTGPTAGQDIALTVSGTGNLNLNGTVAMDIFNNAQTGSLNIDSASDRAVISAADWANVVFGGSSVFKVTTSLDTSTWVNGDSWKMFDWAGIAGGTVPTSGFGTFDLPVLTGLYWDTSALYSSGIISINNVPEPSRALFLMLGLLGLMLRRRRRA